jgi:hypothetical protein
MLDFFYKHHHVVFDPYKACWVIRGPQLLYGLAETKLHAQITLDYWLLQVARGGPKLAAKA